MRGCRPLDRVETGAVYSAACKRQYSSYGEAKPPGLLQARTAWPDNSPWISVGGLQHECMHMQQSVSHTLFF